MSTTASGKSLVLCSQLQVKNLLYAQRKADISNPLRCLFMNSGCFAAFFVQLNITQYLDLWQANHMPPAWPRSRGTD